MELPWERAVVGYLALSGVSLLTATVLGRPPPLPVFILLGPTAWLLWGFASTPFYLIATAIFAGSWVGAILISLRMPFGGRTVLCLAGLLWLLLGLAAWNFNV